MDLRRLKRFEKEGDLIFLLQSDAASEYVGQHQQSWLLRAETKEERYQWLEALDHARQTVGHAISCEGLGAQPPHHRMWTKPTNTGYGYGTGVMAKGLELSMDDPQYTVAMAAIMKRPDADTNINKAEIDRYMSCSGVVTTGELERSGEHDIKIFSRMQHTRSARPGRTGNNLKSGAGDELMSAMRDTF